MTKALFKYILKRNVIFGKFLKNETLKKISYSFMQFCLLNGVATRKLPYKQHSTLYLKEMKLNRDGINPSKAEATFAKSTRMQRF